MYILATIVLLIFIHYLSTRDPRTLIKQSARWLLAAQQDNSNLVALLHVNYAVGYWWALKDTYSDYEIDLAIGGSIYRKRYQEKLLQTQEEITKKISNDCPQFIGEVDPFLATLGGNL